MTSKPGGELIRSMREARAQSIETIALDAGTTYASLSRIERGVTQQPSRGIVERILEALNSYDQLSLSERNAVFKAFNYRPSFPLPSEAEIEWAKGKWYEEYSRVYFPAYLVDISLQVIDWNQYAVRLLGLDPAEPMTRNFENITLFDLAFNLSDSYATIENRDAYIRDFVRTAKLQFHSYQGESWYRDCIDDARSKYPEFRKIWDRLSESELDSTLGSTTPIALRIPKEDAVLRFRLVRVVFDKDPRFIVVQWLPVDEKTVLRCLLWRS